MRSENERDVSERPSASERVLSLRASNSPFYVVATELKVSIHILKIKPRDWNLLVSDRGAKIVHQNVAWAERD
jgi:hypothetical protein